MRRRLGVGLRWRGGGVLLAGVCAALSMLFGSPSALAADRSGDENWNFCLAPFDASVGAPFVLRLAGIFWMQAPAAMATAGAPEAAGAMAAALGIALARMPMPGLGTPVPSGPPPGQAPSARAIPAPPSPQPLDLNRDGAQHVLAGRYPQAEQALRSCLALAVRTADTQADAACSNNLGAALAMSGRLEPAREQFERSQQRYADWSGEIERSSGPGADPMRAMLAEARKEIEQRAASVGRVRAALNLGGLAANGGQMKQADEAFQRALAVPMPPPDPPGCKAAAAQDLARLYRRLGRGSQADALLAQHGARAGLAPSPYMALYLEPGAVSLGVPAAAAPPPAAAAAAAANPLQTLQVETLGRRTEAALQQALLAAQELERAGQVAEATRAHVVVMLRAAAAQRPDVEASAHAALMRLYVAAGQPAAAVHHGKLAVNRMQSVRSGLEARRDAQRGYLRDRAPVYTLLAQVLLDAQRLTEAEQVVQLLKEDEGRQFTVRNAEAAHAQLPLRVAEAQAQARLAQAAQQLQRADDARNEAIASSSFQVSGYAPFNRVDLSAVEQARVATATDPRFRDVTLKGLETAYREADAEARQQPLAAAMYEGILAAQSRQLAERLEHLIEDAPAFTTVKLTPKQMADLSALLQRVRELQATRPKPPETAKTATELSTAAAAGDRLGQVLAGRGAQMIEPMERIWRADRAMQAAEDAQQRDEAELPRRLGAAAIASEGPLGDDTAQLLRQRAPRAAVLYYLPGDERLDVLLVTAQGHRAWRLPLRRVTLDAQIDSLQAALRDRNADPQPAALALYRTLLAPVAPVLDQAGSTPLVLSLSGRLRFVPFAALHDGRQWLVERHALALYPGARLAELMRPPSRHWRVAAFGASLGGAGLAPLPGVRDELASVVRQPAGAAAGSPAGAMPGRGWLDRDFTAQALRTALEGDSQVLHIASHFEFKGGDAAGSFLLLGDGSTLSLQALGGPDYRFDRTELVTLSACQTGLSDADGYGQEVDGLAALLLGRGAPSVLASLWRVSDDSTAELMGTMYRLREDERQGLSRAEALRQAQLRMIRGAAPAGAVLNAAPFGQAGSEPDARSRGVSRPGTESGPGAGKALGRAHPYYWAPFVLMGGWL